MTKLYFVNGPNKDTSLDVESETFEIGRSPHCHVPINDKSISRRHLRIRKDRKKDKFFIKDLGSTNGTFVNGKLMTPGSEIEVKEGSPIGVGNIFFSLEKPCAGAVLAVQDSIDVFGDLNKTSIIQKEATSPKDLELIYKVSSVLMQSLDINEILEKILDYVFDFLKRIDRGVIVLVEDKTGKVLEVISRPTDRGNKTMMYSRTIVNQVLKNGKAVIMSDTLKQNVIDRSESMELMKIKSVMCVPLISRSKTRGVLYVDSVNRPFGFRNEDLSVLTALSSPAAIAIENALLYANLERLVEERTASLSETEQKLRESEARFKAIFDSMSSGVVVYKAINDGDDFVVLDLNGAAQRIEGKTREEAFGKGVLQLFPQIEKTGLPGDFKRVWKTGRPERHSVTFNQDEKKLSAWRDYFIYRLPTGEVVAIIDDVTEKKRAEEEQRALQRQLLMSQKMESIGAFAGGTAHNFRNILQAISGNIEYLEMIHGDKSEVKELSKSIYDSVEKGVDLINNLLHFSRKGEGYSFVDLDLSDVIRKSYEILNRVLDKNIEIELNVHQDLFVKGNHSLLSQVFMNLFTNARDAMPSGGRLVIEAKKEGEEVVAIVSDTGHGMDKETMEKIFDPFFTLKEVGKGTGLGLSTTHGIVEQHGGSISVYSEPGKGATFRICLPLVKTSPVQEPKAQTEIIFGKGQKVLIVDDERPSLDALTNLTKSLGYKAIAVDRPVEALRNYSAWDPDVVLMDRNMPEMDGITCIKRIIQRAPNARIVIVSGYDESGPDGIDESTRNLIKGYITKPCGMGELGRAIAQALEA